MAEPGAAEKVARRVGLESDRRPPGTAATGPGRTAPPLRSFSCSAEHENHVRRCVRERAQRWDVPLLENVPLAPRSRVGTFSRVAILGRRVTEKGATATEKAVETTGGGRSRPRMTDATRHRRAASRSPGATSAERDGRPVSRRTIPDTAAGPESIRFHDSCAGHLFRESRIGEARHSHQEGRRAARRWPQPTEDHKRPTPPQGGEPERRRDQRRT
jgi:hypothetical protein